MRLRVAVAQFPVGQDFTRNGAHIVRLIATAAQQQAAVVLFPETAVGGYPGRDSASFADYDWKAHAAVMQQALDAAKRHGVWVVLGASHRLSGRRKPHNSLYVINAHGTVVDRYDKRFCTVDELKLFQPGTRPVVIKVRGVRCGLLICHEWRYPELYRQYKSLKVDVVLQGWYDGGLTDEEMKEDGATCAEVIPASVQGHAACNHLWICGANTSQRYSCFGGFVVRPDGRFLDRQPRHRAGILVGTVDTETEIGDPAAHGRPRAMRGVEQLGQDLKDPRSTDRSCF